MAAFSSRGPNRSVVARSARPSRPPASTSSPLPARTTASSGTSSPAPRWPARTPRVPSRCSRGSSPDWTPAESQSALMTTAERDITDNDGTKADWFDMGSGRIELRPRRARPAWCSTRRSPATRVPTRPSVATSRTLNTASMADDECLQTCDWTRTFTGTSTGVGTWSVSVENLSPGLDAVDRQDQRRGRPTAATSTYGHAPQLARTSRPTRGCSAPWC